MQTGEMRFLVPNGACRRCGSMAATAASAGAKHQCSPIGTVHVNVSAASSIWHSVAVADGWSCQSSGRRGGGDIGDSVASVPVQRGSRVQPSALHVNMVDAAAAGVNESEWCRGCSGCSRPGISGTTTISSSPTTIADEGQLFAASKGARPRLELPAALPHICLCRLCARVLMWALS